jgi:Putative zinc-finger
MTMNHDRCSELLAAYVDGELDASTMDEVGTHLQGCPDCRLEETALRAMSAVVVTPMSADERSWLHEQVLSGAKGVAEDDAAPAIIVPRRTPWLARVAPALGAVAALLVLAVGVMMVGGNLSGSNDQGAMPSAGADRIGPDGAEEAAGGSPEVGRKDQDQAGDAAATASGEVYALEGKVVRPRFKRLGKVQDRTLRMIGRRDATFNSYFDAFKVRDVDPQQDFLLNRLVQRSPVDLENQIRDCAQVVMSSGPPASLPAFAATAIRDARDILVLGFAWSDQDRGPMYRYMMWSWPLDGDCGNPIGYEAGRITGRR